MNEWLTKAGNEEPWSRLLELLASKQAVAFVGAGASAGLYPIWTALIEKLVNRAGALGVAADDLEFWRQAASREPLETVESLAEAMRPGRYIDSLREIFKPPTSGPSFTKTHEALLHLPFQALVTTNYDLGLSDARGAVRGVHSPLPFTWRDDDVARWLSGELLDGDGLPILHAHGLIKDSQSLILSASAYRRAYADGPWSELFSQLWRQGSLVIVGFSLSDPWIAVLADQALTAAGVRDIVAPGHVAILGLPEAELSRARVKRQHFERRYHAQILFYPVKKDAAGKQDHSALLRLLATAREELEVDGSGAVRPLGPAKTADESGASEHLAPLAAYRRWAAERYGTIDLVGLGAGHLKLPLDEVYVPLRVRSTGRGHRLHGLDPAVRHSAEEISEGFGIDEELDLEQLFTRHEERLVVLFGEPGMGKTTALQKWHQLALADAEALGLAAGTVPVFLRLRRLTPEKLAEPLESFIESEIQILSGDQHPGIGGELWNHGRLLLLFDGLDEIADERHRAEVCHELQRQLATAPDRVRAVISCRDVGWNDVIKKTTLAKKAFPVEVKPFDDQQIARLVEMWFLAAAKEISTYTRAQARTDARQLATALEEERQQQFKSLIATPQLLTLLCVVVHQGGEIPRQRVDFFEKCVKVLLTWRGQAGRKPPVESGQLLRVLAEIGFFLHQRHERDTLQEPKAVELIARMVSLDEVEEVWQWLCYEAGLLRLSESDYGFLHLHVQEYAAALALAEDEERLAAACADWAHDEGSWWQEVFLLLAALPGRATFAPLARHLLKTTAPVQRADLLASCLREASDPDLTPILEVLKRQDAGQQTRDAALLRLVQGRKDPALLELVKELESKGSKAIQTEAKYVRQLATGKSQRDCHLALIHHPDDHAIAKRLRRFMEQGSLTVFRSAEGRTWKAVRELTTIIKRCQAVVLLAGSRPIDPENLESLIKISPPEMTRRILTLPADPPAKAPANFSAEPPLEIAGFEDRHLLDAVAAYRSSFEAPEPPAPAPAAESHRDQSTTRSRKTRTRGERSLDAPAKIDQQKIWREPLTGMEFLTVPAGSFEMGSKNHERSKPVHEVELSEFLLGRTPVTNREYAIFMKATGHREPQSWRDRKFSAEQQPVIGVDWNDCSKFCDWLTGATADGLRFSLPTEAQWEYAARSAEGRLYPWRDAKPNKTLASFSKTSKDRPPEVGSFPAGAGPFGHLDLAGTVWEWCVDEWEKDYQRRVEAEEFLNPVGKGDSGLRPLRGGSWAFDALFLGSAFRYRYRPESRNPSIGFRVVAAPASLAP